MEVAVIFVPTSSKRIEVPFITILFSPTFKYFVYISLTGFDGVPIPFLLTELCNLKISYCNFSIRLHKSLI